MSANLPKHISHPPMTEENDAGIDVEQESSHHTAVGDANLFDAGAYVIATLSAYTLVFRNPARPTGFHILTELRKHLGDMNRSHP